MERLFTCHESSKNSQSSFRLEHEIHAGSIKLAGAQSLQHVSNVTEDSLEDSEPLKHKSTTMKIIIEDGCLVVPQDS